MTAFDAGLDALKPLLWTIRDPDGVEYDGHIDGYRSAKGTPVDGDVGSWELVLPAGHKDISALLEEGAGVVVRPPGSSVVLWSGQVDQTLTRYSPSDRSTTFTGVTDEEELQGEVAWPDPAHWLNDVAGNNVVSGAVDARTGAAETVLLAYISANLSFHDVHVDRRRPYLNIPSSGGHGTTVHMQANFDQLIDLAKIACRGTGITWRIVQGDPGELDLVIRVRQDVSADVIFSKAEGSLVDSAFTRQRPAVTQGIAVTDTGSARSYALVTDATAEALWRRRFVTVGDAPSSIISDQTQAAGDLIAAGIEKAGASMQAAVLPKAPQWGVDYFLGDRVTVVDDTGFAISDYLAQMDYEHVAGSGPTLQPSVGYALLDLESAMVPIVRDATRRLRTLERRKP